MSPSLWLCTHCNFGAFECNNFKLRIYIDFKVDPFSNINPRYVSHSVSRILSLIFMFDLNISLLVNAVCYKSQKLWKLKVSNWPMTKNNIEGHHRDFEGMFIVIAFFSRISCEQSTEKILYIKQKYLRYLF